MQNEIIRGKWEDFISKYKIYFLANEEEWLNTLESVKNYIDNNNKRPSTTSKDTYIKKIGLWISTQNNNYSQNKNIMLKNIIREKWLEFINDIKYKIYFLSNEEEWLNTLESVKKYIDNNNKRPSQHDKDINIKILGSWIGTQQKNYSKKEYIMKNDIIRGKWKEFINNTKYRKHFNKTITL
jgi:antitoxin component HigA of HigAB toxin-antitoxin module